jgi:linker between RRM2 and RRM3 domains in RBM39 protein
MVGSGSGIRDKHPGSATLVIRTSNIDFFFVFSFNKQFLDCCLKFDCNIEVRRLYSSVVPVISQLLLFLQLIFSFPRIVFILQDDDRAGFDLGATGRLALMAKLAEGTGTISS